MNNLVKFCLILISGTVFVSCIEINGSGYSTLSEEEKLHVKPCKTPLDCVTNDGNLYKVTVDQVKDYIRTKHNVLIFEYIPFCSGESGRNPKEIKASCNKRNVNCIIISSVYDHIFPIPEDYTFPLFVIDNEPYKTDNYQKYGEAFYKSLIHIDDENRYCSYHYFCDGEYVCSFDLLTDFDKSKAVVADVQK